MGSIWGDSRAGEAGKNREATQLGRVGGRVVGDGKFLRVGRNSFHVRGVAYGGFAARLDGWQFPERVQVKKDLTAIAFTGLNTVRTYTLPPPDIFEICEELDLRLLVGIHFDDWRMEPDYGRKAQARILDAGRRAVDQAMATMAGNPTVLAVAVGNEIPVDLIRLHGARAVEKTLSQLIEDVHEADPHMLATYVNFPTTEYLEPAGQDLLTFNVFLERPTDLRKYVHHLQVLAADKPLVLTELGLASEVHGEAAQAESIASQLEVIDELGCAGGAVFSWTDEWAVDDVAVLGWGFGVTTTDRRPKASLGVLEKWGGATYPAGLRVRWPKVSVVVCAYNEERNLDECLSSLIACSYPDLEVIVCDDGSTDATLEIANRFPFKVLALESMGLSAARNAGLAASTGEIVAYLDADAACHPEWPFHLALSLEDESVVATGGPNLAFDKVGFVERAIGHAPGTAAEVLLTPDRAEHVPGCNMAFRRDALEDIGGFDPTFTSAGDDVDVCWKLLDRGYQIGFAPAAQVRHHRRSSVVGYLRQQRGYGRAEKMLAGAHPHRFNLLGQARWQGAIYGGTRVIPSILRPVVYTGHMGMAPFQPITTRRSEAAGAWAAALLPLALAAGLLGIGLSVFSRQWLALPIAAAAVSVVYASAVGVATRPSYREPWPLRLRWLVALLHILQPIARTWGRLTGRKAAPSSGPGPAWLGDRSKWICDVEQALKSTGCSVRPAGTGASWDLTTHLGPMVSARIVTAVVWQWEPRIRVRYRLRWPAVTVLSAGIVLGVIGPPIGWAVVGLAAGWIAVGAVSLGRRIARAFAWTTSGMTS